MSCICCPTYWPSIINLPLTFSFFFCARCKGDFRSELCSDGEAMRIDPEGKPYLVPWKMRGSLSEIMIYDTTNISNMVFDTTNKIYSMLRGLFFWVSSWLFFKSAPGGKRFRKMGFTVSVSIKLWGCGVSRYH